jgi:hypothetical protein
VLEQARINPGDLQITEDRSLSFAMNSALGERRWEMIAFAILWLGLCVFFSFGAVQGAFAQRDAAARYLPIEEIVTKAETISAHTNTRSRGGRLKYQPRLTYAYTVGGNRFSSSQYYLAGAGQWTDLEEAKATIAGNPAGSKIQAFYDPASPKMAVVSLNPTSNIFIWIMLAFWMFGLALLATGIRGTRKPGVVPGEHHG